jgi:hypothetical protein
MRKLLSQKRSHRVCDLDEGAIATKLESSTGEEGFHNEQEFSYKSRITGSWSLGEASAHPLIGCIA